MTKILLIAAAGLLSFANGANDNFKGVATLWGAQRATYKRALAWAIAFTFLGSLAAMRLGAGLAAKFNGSKLVPVATYTDPRFLAAVVLGAATTVLLASRLGLPVSTTHALVGALVGIGITAAGAGNVRFAALGKGIVLPLLFSPCVAMLLTVAFVPVILRLSSVAGIRDCVCVDLPEPAVVVGNAGAASMAAFASPSVRVAPSSECQTGAEVIHWNVSDGLHWFSGAAISVARGLNDTPKIAAVLLAATAAGAAGVVYVALAAAMALGGVVWAARVAHTLSKEITPMPERRAVIANLVSAALVLLASPLALPVSTTHVTSGSVFGIGLLDRKKADWRRVRDILLSWVGTLPLAAAFGAGEYWILSRI